MGKFSTYQKRGTARQFGTVPPPEAADWTFTSPVAGQYTITKLVAFPPPAAQFRGRIRQASTAWTNTTASAGPPISGSATSGILHFAQIAWMDAAGNLISPWSDTKQVVIT